MKNETHNILWDQYEFATLEALKHGNCGKAVRILKEAFREAEEYGEIPAVLVTQAYSLAERRLQQRRYTEAESLFRLVLEAREKLLGQTHEDVVESLKKVAVVQIMAFRAEALGYHAFVETQSWLDAAAAAS